MKTERNLHVLSHLSRKKTDVIGLRLTSKRCFNSDPFQAILH